MTLIENFALLEHCIANSLLGEHTDNLILSLRRQGSPGDMSKDDIARKIASTQEARRQHLQAMRAYSRPASEHELVEPVLAACELCGAQTERGIKTKRARWHVTCADCVSARLRAQQPTNGKLWLWWYPPYCASFADTTFFEGEDADAPLSGLVTEPRPLGNAAAGQMGASDLGEDIVRRPSQVWWQDEPELADEYIADQFERRMRREQLSNAQRAHYDRRPGVYRNVRDAKGRVKDVRWLGPVGCEHDSTDPEIFTLRHV